MRQLPDFTTRNGNKMKIYKIKRIEEADYGCEERPEGQETMVGIRLKAEDGEEIHRQEADAELYAKNINEGDKVIFIEGRIEKQC